MKNYRQKFIYTFIIISLLNVVMAIPADNAGLSTTTTFILPNNQATNVQIPVELQWSGTSGNVDIEIVNCTVDPNTQIGTIDLGKYEKVSGPTVITQIPDDLSGITYNALTNTLFMVANGNTMAYETDLAGNVLRNIFLSGFDDTEGIVHISGTRYAVSEERRGRIAFFDITASTTNVLYSNADYAEFPTSLGPWGANIGLEGVSYDPNTGLIHTIKEKDIKAYYSFEPPTSYPTILNAAYVNSLCNMQLNPFGFGDISGLHHLGLTTGLSQLGVGTHTLLLSHESLALVETDLNCNEVSRISFSTGGANGTMSNAMAQPEGVTMDNDGNLYIVSEPNRLYIFSNPSLNINPVDLQGTVHTSTTASNSYTVPSGVLEAGTEYCWRINDGSGWTDYWSFTTSTNIENVCPTANIISPINNTQYNSPGTITIQANVYDYEGDIASVDFYVDGALLGTGSKIGTANTYEINYTLISGSHGLSAVVTDGAGCKTTSSFVIINADIVDQPPTVNITSPADGLVLGSAAPVTIVANATDSDGVVTQVEFFINGQSIGVDNSPNYTMSYNFAQVPDGVYEVVTVATDNASNISSDTIYIQVGFNQAPYISITQPTDNAILTSFQTLTIETTAGDPDGFVSKVDFFVNGVYIGGDTNSPFEMPYSFTSVGDFELKATVTDNAGVITTSTPVNISVEIDNFPPEVQLVSPENGANHTPLEVITIEAQAEDPDGDIQHVEFFIDGVSLEIDDEYPFLTIWQLPSEGTHIITAIATDIGGAQSNLSQSNVNISYGDILTTSSMINNVNDDVEEQAPDGAIDDGDMYFNSSDLECGMDSNKGNQILGLRFNGLNIPQGVLIMSAYIQFMADESDAGATTAIITGEAADNAAPFTSIKYDLSSRPATSNPVSWTIPEWTTGEKTAAQKSPELKSIIQEIVSRPGYSAASSIVLKVEGTGQRVAEARDGNRPNDAAQLIITYTMDSCPPKGTICDDGDPDTFDTTADGYCGCSNANIGLFVEIPISNGNDDAEENGIDGGVDLTSSDIELTHDRASTGNQVVGLRFDNLFLDSGAIIDSAFIQFTVDETRNSAGTLNIYGEASGTSQPFTNTPFDISGREESAASVTWNPNTWNTVGTKQQSPDVSSIVQEIINRSDWIGNNNPITFIIEGTGKRVAKSYEGSVEFAPKLLVYYTTVARESQEDDDEITISPTSSIPIEYPSYSNQNSIIKQVKIFPNPVSDELNINMKLDNVQTDIGFISIIDMNGRIIQQQTFNPMTQQAMDTDVSSLRVGMYAMQIQINDYTTVHKFIKN